MVFVRLSDEVVGPGVEAFVAGMSRRDAAVLAGISENTLSRRMTELGLSRRGRCRFPDSRFVVALAAVAGGASQVEAARLVGVSSETLRTCLCGQGGRVMGERKFRVGWLSMADREEIRVGIVRGESDSVIAGRVGCHRGTIGREIAANGGRGKYRAWSARDRSLKASLRPKMFWFEERPWLWDETIKLLRLRWSPEQISARLRLDHPTESQWWVSHEAIYQAIYVQACGELRTELVKCLRFHRPTRRSQGRVVSNGKIGGMVNISDRPAEASDRAVPGNWEGDLINGTGNATAVVTLIDRKTLTAILIKIDNKTTAPRPRQLHRDPQRNFRSRARRSAQSRFPGLLGSVGNSERAGRS